MLKKIRNTPEWVKIVIPFFLGTLVSTPIQDFCNLLYKDNSTLFTGNVTLIAEKLNISGGQLLFNFIVVIILLGLFIFLAWAWTRKDDTKTIGDIHNKLDTILEKIGNGKRQNTRISKKTKKDS